MTEVETFFKAPKPKPRPLGRRKPRKVDASLWTMDLSVPIVVARSHGICEHPDGCNEPAEVFHHRRGRGFAGCHAPKLILHLCKSCHVQRTHGDVKRSYVNGAMLKRTARYELVVRPLGPSRYNVCCPNCATWTPVVGDRRTAVQAATSCCAVPAPDESHVAGERDFLGLQAPTSSAPDTTAAAVPEGTEA